MATITIKCQDCEHNFYYTDRDQAFYKQHGFADPKRCFNCRRKKKIEREARERGDYKGSMQ